MKIYKLNNTGTKWTKIDAVTYEDTLMNWIKLYNDELELIGYGIY